MTAYTGANLYLAFTGVTIQSDYRSFEPSGEIGTEDASAGSDAGITRLTTLEDGTASLTMRSISGTAGTALWVTTFAVGNEGTLEWGPEGTATNNRRSYVNAIVKTKSETLAYAGVSEWNVTWEYSDVSGPTHTTY